MTFAWEIISADDPRLSAALVAADLPILDLAGAGRLFFRVHAAGRTIGFGGLEGEGRHKLLRSIVVLPEHRAHGAGAQIVRIIEARAAESGTRRLHLLTTHAAAFFRRIGYAEAERKSAPSDVAASAQFSAVCPASAIYLFKDIGA